MSGVSQTTPDRKRGSSTVRVHRMRIARGACWVIVAALAVGAALTCFDAVVPLHASVRGIALAAWVTGIGVLVWRLVALRIPADPDTASRHAKVELAGNMRAAAAAALVLSASLVAATVVPGAGEHIRRVALPWSRTIGPLYYRVMVTSGELVVRRGDSVTLSAYAEKIDPSAAAADAATLVWRDRNGEESRLSMAGDGSGAFHATRYGVAMSFQYRVEIGTAASEWFSVAVLDPANPTNQSSIELRPPRYAPDGARTSIAGFAPFEGTQHSTAELRFRFSRPAGAAFLEWRADGAAPIDLVPVSLGTDRLTGTASFRLQQSGSLKLVTVAEEDGKSLRGEYSVRVRVVTDTPPRLQRIAGVSPRPRSARPNSRVPVEFTASDDVSVGSAVLEYVIGPDESKVMAISISLTGAQTTQVSGAIELDLAGKALEGESIRFRVRVFDTRRLDDQDLKPQEAVYPATGWSVVRIDSAATPLDEQDILAQRNLLGDVLLASLEQIKGIHKDVGRIRSDAAGKSSLPLDLSVRMNDARDGAAKVADALRKAAAEASLTLELRPLSAAIHSAADIHLKNTEDALTRAATDNSTERGAALAAANELLGETLARLDRLIAANQLLAQARLDRKAIESLAVEQSAIANLARPGGTATSEEIARLERDLFARLRKLVAESEPLRTASGLARHQEIRRLVASGKELAALTRDLDAAARRLHFDTRKELLRAVAVEQGLVVSTVAALGSKAETAARLIAMELPKSDRFAQIADLIVAGKSVEALTALEQLARELDAIATAIEKWSVDRLDPKSAAVQLAQWQNDIVTRFRVATKDNSANFETLPPATKTAFAREQSAVHQAATVLRFPQSSEMRKLHAELLKNVGDAGTSLGKNGANADSAMKLAVEAFNTFAEKLPTIPERLTKARADFAKVQIAQEAILFGVEQAVRTNEAARKFPALLDQQLKQVEAFRALDIPNSEGRVNCITVALAAAVTDLRDASVSDALASQQWLKREFDRLRLALDGLAPPDARAEELARKLDSLSRAIEALGPMPTAKQLEIPLAESQELARQVLSFGLPAEAPSLANEARLAATALEIAGHDPKLPVEELRKRVQKSADAMARLSDRLFEREPDLDRVRRLAASRWSALREAEKNQGKPANPDVSGEAARQLVREAEELSSTRVGFAGLAHKKKILELYYRHKEHPSPDRQGGPLRALAESLDELAALMADVEYLATPVNRKGSASPATDADNYLPTSALAEQFRDLALKQRALRSRITEVTEAALKLIRPAEANPLADLEKKQRELAAEITAFARKLETENEPAAAKLALEAAINATLAADGLAVGMLLPAGGSADLAAQALRRVATAGGTKPLAKSASDFAARLDALRGKMTVPATPDVVAAQQKARGEDLSRRTDELARQLELAARSDGMQEVALLGAAKELTVIAKLIDEATRKGAEGRLADATKLRAEAAVRLSASAAKVAALVPAVAMSELDPAAVKTAAALGRAESAMRQALEELEPKPDRAAAEKAMRDALESLNLAAKARAESIER